MAQVMAAGKLRFSFALAVAALSPLGAAGGAETTHPVPPLQATRIAEEYGRWQAYLPTRLPSGFIYTRWTIIPGRFTAAGRVLRMTFGKNGTRLIWTVARAVEPIYSRCQRSDFPHYKRRSINGRVVYYDTGIHGNEASACLSVRGPYGPDRLSVSLWVENNPRHPSEQQAELVVATARPRG